MGVYPILFQKGPIVIYTYGVFMALALLAVRFSIYKYAYQPEETPLLNFLNNHFFGIIIASLLGARLFFVLEHLDLFYNNFIDIFLIQQGGFSFFGGLLFCLIFIFFLVRKQTFSFLQLMALLLPAVSLGQAIGRIGCYFAGCCAGSITFLPIQIISSSAHLIIFIILLIVRSIYRPDRFAGVTCGFYLLLHGLFRFFISFYRTHTVPVYYHLKIHQWICLTMILIGLILVIRSTLERKSP